jgi:HPt (histidine-containing phosphotransfer) domain-containing protein
MKNQKKEVEKLDFDTLYKYFDYNKEILVGFLQLFIEQSGKDVNELENFVNEKNFKKISQQSHKIKSVYASMGLQQTYEILSNIETNALKSENIDEILNLFGEFRNIHNAAEKDAKKILNQN